MRYVEKYGTARVATDGIITQRMYFACWVFKVTNTLRTRLKVTFTCTVPVFTGIEQKKLLPVF
jgi:aminopeptidase C